MCLPIPSLRLTYCDVSVPNTDPSSLDAESASLRRQVEGLQEENKTLRGERDRLRQAYQRALEQLQLLRRRLFVAKAERVPVAEEQLAFDSLLAEVERLGKALDEQGQGDPEREDDAKDKPKPKPSGRRDLKLSQLPVERIEILDDELEGKAERIGFEEQSLLGYQRGGHRRLVMAYATYKLPSPAVETTSLEVPPAHAAEPASTGSTPRFEFIQVEPAKLLFRRGMLAPSLVAHLLVSKYLLGVPFYRQEACMAFEGASLDRGTMCRYAEDAGATLGAIVEAMAADAKATAFCLSTDATGVSVQPEPIKGKHQACRRGHFFVVLADRDHIFFEYQAKHTSAAVSEMFKGYAGYIQADAHVIYDALFLRPTDDKGQGPPSEVGCWSHVRRHFWEACVCKHPLGLAGLRKIDELFAIEAKFKEMPPSKRHALRQQLLRPKMAAFFEWVERERGAVVERGLIASALGYASRQKEALTRVLEDGRLKMDNNGSERALRRIAVGRKAWLFIGSDDHGEATANLYSLMASCQLHGLDPEAYLAEVIHVMPYWPRDRYLELAPKNWAATRAGLRAKELARELGPITVPGAMAKEKAAASRGTEHGGEDGDGRGGRPERLSVQRLRPMRSRGDLFGSRAAPRLTHGALLLARRLKWLKFCLP